MCISLSYLLGCFQLLVAEALTQTDLNRRGTFYFKNQKPGVGTDLQCASVIKNPVSLCYPAHLEAGFILRVVKKIAPLDDTTKFKNILKTEGVLP